MLNPEALAGFSWTAPRRAPSAARARALAERPGPAVSDLQRDAQAEAQAPRSSTRARAPAEIGRDDEARSSRRSPPRWRATTRVRAFSARQGRHAALRAARRRPRSPLRAARAASSGALGEPERRPVVQLRMRAAILDGMFTGSVNAMQAAMEGEVAFTGDAGKAMAMQQLQGDMRRLYRAARERGRRPGRPRRDPAAGRCGAARRRGREAGRRERHPRRDRRGDEGALRDPGDHGDRRQRVRADPGHADEVWITPSQLFKGDLRPEVLVRIDLDGNSLDEGARSPSSEWLMHARSSRRSPRRRR